MFENFGSTPYNFILLIAGVFVLMSILLPLILKKRIITEPIIYLAIGAIYFIITGDFKPSRLMGNTPVLLHLSEITVLLALTSTGLKLNKPFSKFTWKYSYRLLLIGMPITILLTYLLGNFMLGMLPATAMLLGAVLSPTDPVLAADLQTTKPGIADTSTTKITLTSEAGLNDGLAFPFTYLAIRLADPKGFSDTGIWDWIWYDVGYRFMVGIAVGLIMGYLLYKLIFLVLSKTSQKKIGTGMLSLSLTVLPYVCCEYLHGYGFIAVFLAACMFRKMEADTLIMQSLHQFSEEIENLMIAILFIVFGVYSALNWRLFLNWELASCALILIFLVRPIAGYISLIRSPLKPIQRFTISFFGIRGIGSIYYLAFALQSTFFQDKNTLIGLVFLTIIGSVFIHGLSAGFFINKLHRTGEEKQ